MNMDHSTFVLALLDPTQPVPRGWCAYNHSDPTPRWNVYRNNVVNTLLQVLHDTFPVLAQELGAAQFMSLTDRYLHAHPPQHPVMTFYGEGLPDFLRTQLEVSDRWLCDLARLEFLRVHAFHAKDSVETFDTEDWLTLTQRPDLIDRAAFEFSADVSVVRSAGPVFDAWAAYQTECTPFEPGHGPQSALVTREGYVVVVIRITDACALFIESLKNGLTLGQAVDRVIGIDPAFDLVGSLALLVKQRCFCGMILTN